MSIGNSGRKKGGRRQTRNKLLMEILSPTALGMGQMEQENLKQFIAECVCAHECEFPR